jgi:hypothetical protein
MTDFTRGARRAALAAAAFLAAPSLAHACACGCGIFDIGDGTLMPSDSPSGFTAWFRYSYMDQNRNWEFGTSAPSADNTDKRISTNFYTFGGQYMINHRWSVMAELPIYDRTFVSTDDGTVAGPAGSLYTGRITSLGDLVVTGLYTGLSSDMSTGLSFGVKLPTGAYTSPLGPLGGAQFDRDTLPGTGSTDLVFGAYHVGKLDPSGRVGYFIQAKYQIAVATRDGYRPGDEFDAAIGANYNLGAFGVISRLAPGLQLINSYRGHDTGDNAAPPNSGYERLLIAPGLEFRVKRVRFYADVALPIYQRVNSAVPGASDSSGQLVAPALFKVQAAYSF